MSRLSNQEARALERLVSIDKKSMQVIDAVGDSAIVFCRSTQKFAAIPIGVKNVRLYRDATWFKRVEGAYSLAKSTTNNTKPILVIYEEYKSGKDRWDVAEVCLQAGRIVVTKTGGEPFERWSYSERLYAFSGTRNEARKLVRKMNAATKQFDAVSAAFRKRVGRRIDHPTDLVLELSKVKQSKES
jgi:hypothetical protein